MMGANKAGMESVGQIRTNCMHGAVGAENFIPAEANMELMEYVGQCGHYDVF